MTDEGAIIVAVFLALLIGGGYALFWVFAKSVTLSKELLDERQAKKERARLWVEQRIMDLFREFPDMAAQNPGAIALLVHDELVNRRVTDTDFLVWAVPATSERLWRSVLVEIEREQRRGA